MKSLSFTEMLHSGLFRFVAGNVSLASTGELIVTDGRFVVTPVKEGVIAGDNQADAAFDYASLEEDAARVVLAYLHGDKIELDEAVHALMSNGRYEWWKKYKPIGLRGEEE